MPKFRVANVYIIRCVHEVEADNDQQAIERGMDQEDELDTARAKYAHTYVIEEIKEE
jgi:hypothetical protein